MSTNQGVALVVQGFHANLPYQEEIKVFVRLWVPFDSATINMVFKLKDDDNDAYRELFKAPNYDLILKALTDGKRP